MPERDAFGREIGEDALADMGWKEPTRGAPGPQWTAFDAGEAWRIGREKKDADAPGEHAPRGRPAGATSAAAAGAGSPARAGGSPAGLAGSSAGVGGPARPGGAAAAGPAPARPMPVPGGPSQPGAPLR